MNADVDAMLRRHRYDGTRLIDMLWDIQRLFGHIPDELLPQIATAVNRSPLDIVETASFYHFFHNTPSGRHRIYLSNTVIAKMHGYRQVYEALELETGTRFGGPDSADFGLFETACIGLSDHEPAMLIDGVVFTDLTPASVAEIIEGLKRGDLPAQIANPAGLPRDDVAYVDALTRTTVHTSGPVFFCGDTDYRALLHRCRAMTPEDVIATISESGLRGR
ncbi:MAG: NAD(P)H-dependent oxidoreductase subunit E, partial [Mycobacterium sp.]